MDTSRLGSQTYNPKGCPYCLLASRAGEVGTAVCRDGDGRRDQEGREQEGAHGKLVCFGGSQRGLARPFVRKDWWVCTDAAG